ncbi:hypothetical protein L1887_05391 [Cichorium endivia]|nr:hypothetical protein L1887_05391 [Cichorium endivia]
MKNGGEPIKIINGENCSDMGESEVTATSVCSKQKVQEGVCSCSCSFSEVEVTCEICGLEAHLMASRQAKLINRNCGFTFLLSKKRRHVSLPLLAVCAYEFFSSQYPALIKAETVWKFLFVLLFFSQLLLFDKYGNKPECGSILQDLSPSILDGQKGAKVCGKEAKTRLVKITKMLIRHNYSSILSGGCNYQGVDKHALWINSVGNYHVNTIIIICLLAYLCYPNDMHKTRLHIRQLLKDTPYKLMQASETDVGAVVSIHIGRI